MEPLSEPRTQDAPVPATGSGVATNRLATSLDFSRLPPGAGMDKLALSFLLSAYEQDPSAWGHADTLDPGLATERRMLSTDLQLGEGQTARLKVHPSPTGSWAHLEWNPARHLDRGGTSLASVAGTLSSAAQVWRAASELVDPAGPVSMALVRRLDVARDFDVTSPSRLLSGLVLLPRAWARSTQVWVDAQSGRIESIQTGGRSSHVRLYDKQAQAPAKVPTPRLRWELQARRRWLDAYGSIARLADLTETAVAALASDRWLWSQMGTTVSDLGVTSHRVTGLGLSPSRHCTLVGYLVLRSLGELPTFASQTVRTYEDLARHIGATDSDLFGTLADRLPSVRLDWATGTEVSDD